MNAFLSVMKLFGLHPKKQGRDRMFGRLDGTFVDLEKARRLFRQGEWRDALSVINGILHLPSDDDEAKKHVALIMKDQTIATIDIENRLVVLPGESVQIVLGGGMVAELINLRAKCIIKVLLAIGYPNAIGAGMALIPNDRALSELRAMSLQHTSIVGALFADDVDSLLTTAVLCYIINYLDIGRLFTERLLRLRPEDEDGRELLRKIELKVNY